MEFLPRRLPDGRQMLYAWFSAMHTRVDIVLLGGGEVGALENVAQNIEKEIARIEKFANKFDAQSELSCANQLAWQQPVAISAELSEILIECEAFRNSTLGYFDIAVNSQLTTDAPKYTVEKQMLKFEQPDVQLDLSGYIKGYALRRIKLLLDAEAIADALINIGNSSIMARGNHPYGNGWAVQTAQTEQTYTLHNECLTTSGNHAETLWPIVNPKTGESAEQAKAISVITTDGAAGEVLAKAHFFGEGGGKKFDISPPIPSRGRKSRA